MSQTDSDYDTEIYCSICDKYFDATIDENGECPKCGNQYWWDSINLENGDIWPIVQFEQEKR